MKQSKHMLAFHQHKLLFYFSDGWKIDDKVLGFSTGAEPEKKKVKSA